MKIAELILFLLPFSRITRITNRAYLTPCDGEKKTPAVATAREVFNKARCFSVRQAMHRGVKKFAVRRRDGKGGTDALMFSVRGRAATQKLLEICCYVVLYCSNWLGAGFSR